MTWVSPGLASVHALTLLITVVAFSAKSVITGASCSAIASITPWRLPLRVVKESLSRAALSAASWSNTTPISWAFCFISSSPAAPPASIGNNAVPALPNTSWAVAACAVLSVMPARAMLSISNCCSGLLPTRSSTLTPILSSASTLSPSPSFASTITLLMRRMPVSMPFREEPDKSAATRSSDNASVLNPVRRAIFWTSSPSFANWVMLATPSPVMSPPATVAARPTDFILSAMPARPALAFATSALTCMTTSLAMLQPG